MAAASAAVVAAATSGVKYNAQMEQYATSFEVMLGSSEEALAKIAELKEFAAKIEQLGFGLVLDKVELNITGMSCAACSAAVEKSVARLPFVTNASVNLATEKLDVIFDEKKGSLQDIAAAVVYLASERAGYVTGQELHVNGGMYM